MTDYRDITSGLSRFHGFAQPLAGDPKGSGPFQQPTRPTERPLDASCGQPPTRERVTSDAAASDTSLEPPETSENPGKEKSPDLRPLVPGSKTELWRHSGWWAIRKRVHSSLQRTEQSPSRIASFEGCGRQAYIQVAANDANEWRITCNHCGDRLCTPCANLRSLRLRDALMHQIGTIKPLFITLTLCGKGESLTDLVDRLYRSFKALRNHPTWSEKIRGGAAFLEVKYNDKSQRWHPHLHIMADGGFVPQQDLCNAWRSITKDSFICDIRRVGDRAQAASYVAKYASKPLNTSFAMSPVLLDESVNALRGRRLCLTFGTWYNTPLDMVEEEELLEEELGRRQWKDVALLEDVLNGLSSEQLIPDLIKAKLRLAEIKSIAHAFDSS